jgi:hypothetical protein
MPGRVYRIDAETVGIVSRNNVRVTVMIPEGARVIVENAEVGSRLIDVLWEGQTVMIFTEDLQERGTLIQPPVQS